MPPILGAVDPLAQADLAGRDFAAERDQAVVVSTGAAVSDLDRERSAEARAVAEVCRAC